jgi:hypothetical protein
MAIVGLVVLGDGLLTENQRADAQTISRPNFVFVMTDDLDEHSMEDLTGLTPAYGRMAGSILLGQITLEPNVIVFRGLRMRTQKPLLRDW